MTSETDTIIIEHLLTASIEDAWRSWTDPVYISQWFGSDPNGVVLESAVDARVGGSFEITFRDSSGLEHTCFGFYTDVKPLHSLQFTWSWRSEPGVESRVSVTLYTEGEGTQMRFVHAGVGTASAHNYDEGWRSTFEKLDRMLLKK